MKLNEITDSNEYQSKVSLVAEDWENWRNTRLQTLNRVTNYLFVLNTGALLASLTYIVSKGVSEGVQASIWLFSIGIVFILIHAALDYYLTEISFSTYRKDVNQLYQSTLDWEVFIERNANRPPCDWLLHMLGWLGGIAFLIGLFLGLYQIPSII
jgi:hypothetical protein